MIRDILIAAYYHMLLTGEGISSTYKGRKPGPSWAYAFMSRSAKKRGKRNE